MSLTLGYLALCFFLVRAHFGSCVFLWFIYICIFQKSNIYWLTPQQSVSVHKKTCTSDFHLNFFLNISLWGLKIHEIVYIECGEVPIMFPNDFLHIRYRKKHLECNHEDHSAIADERFILIVNKMIRCIITILLVYYLYVNRPFPAHLVICCSLIFSLPHIFSDLPWF